MKIQLNEREVMRAIEVYIASKMGSSTPLWLQVKIHWRGRTATVESGPRPVDPTPEPTAAIDLTLSPAAQEELTKEQEEIRAYYQARRR